MLFLRNFLGFEPQPEKYKTIYQCCYQNNKTMKHTIGFSCREGDELLEVQLEPEGMIFTLLPGEEWKFVANNAGDEFEWFLRIEHQSKCIQLFPEYLGNEVSIDVYKNDQLFFLKQERVMKIFTKIVLSQDVS